jgi:hypothetical protein
MVLGREWFVEVGRRPGARRATDLFDSVGESVGFSG